MARHEVCKVSELPEGEMKSIAVGDNRILVAKVSDKFYAMRAICNHEGGPLDEGPMYQGEITCPWHGSVWDVRTGKMVWFNEQLKDEPVYQVIVENDTLFVEA